MNTKFILFLSCFTAVTLTASLVIAAPRGGSGGMGRGGAHFSSMPAGSGSTFTSGGSRTFNQWSGDWRHHRFSRDRFIFIDTFGFPFFYPYPYYGYYPYGYYSYNDYGYGYGNTVVEVQRRLARAGYYHGPIDGIMGPQTRRAIRAYERNHNMPAYGVTDQQLVATMGLG